MFWTVRKKRKRNLHANNEKDKMYMIVLAKQLITTGVEIKVAGSYRCRLILNSTTGSTKRQQKEFFLELLNEAMNHHFL